VNPWALSCFLRASRQPWTPCNLMGSVAGVEGVLTTL